MPSELAALTHYNLAEVQQEFVTETGTLREIQLSVEGLTCAACAWLIQRHLMGLPACTMSTSTPPPTVPASSGIRTGSR